MRQLCFYGNPVLRKKCKEVTDVNDPHVKKVIKDLKEVTIQKDGAGLAANQIGYDVRIFANAYAKKVDREGYPLLLDEPEVYINPKIVKRSKRKFTRMEGCLSIPGMHAEVVRDYEIVVEFLDEQGNKHVSTEKKWRAKCIQHEIDHLDGILYTDLVSEEDKARIEPQLVALEAQTKMEMGAPANPNDFFM